MLVRRPVSDVFEAIVDPAITSHFWFSNGSGRFVEVEETGWTGTGDELLKFVCESTGGFTWTLAGMKAYLEHGLELDLVADRFPKNLDRRCAFS